MASWARCCNKTLPLTNTIRLHFRDWATSSRRVCSHVHTADCCICVALWGVWKVEPTKAVEGRRPLVANNKLSGSTCLSHAVYCLLCLCSVKYYVYKYYYAYHVYVYIYIYVQSSWCIIYSRSIVCIIQLFKGNPFRRFPELRDFLRELGNVPMGIASYLECHVSLHLAVSREWQRQTGKLWAFFNQPHSFFNASLEWENLLEWWWTSIKEDSLVFLSSSGFSNRQQQTAGHSGYSRGNDVADVNFQLLVTICRDLESIEDGSETSHSIPVHQVELPTIQFHRLRLVPVQYSLASQVPLVVPVSDTI